MNRRLWLTFAFFAVIGIIGISCITLIGITPTDTKIIDLLDENRGNLLSVIGVVGAGIARDENNHIIGIAVYVENNLTAIYQLPSKLGEFTVFVKDVTKVSEFEKGSMIVKNAYCHLLNVTTTEVLFWHNDNVTIAIKNESNKTFTFGNSVYDLFFDWLNGTSWEFYTGVLGLEVITYLDPGERVEVEYKLGGQTDKPFPAGKYRVFSKGWLDKNGQSIPVWGHAEFTVE